MLIRAALPTEVETIAAIWHAGWRDGHLGHVPNGVLAERTAEAFARRVDDRIDDFVCAEVDSEIAGFFVAVDDEVEQIYVDAAHRGSGIASRLLDAAETHIADDAGVFVYLAEAQAGSIEIPSHRYVKDLSTATTPARCR